MKAGAKLLAISMFMSSCGSAEPIYPLQEAREGEAMNSLSISAELFLTTLTATAPEPLTTEELCKNGGICGEDFNSALNELTARGLVRSSQSKGYELTEVGSRYIDQNYHVVRNGDDVSIETRGGDTPR